MQSLLIFLKFVPLCLLLYMLCCIYNFFQSFDLSFLCFTQFRGGSHGLNFDNFRDADPLSTERN